MGICNTPWCCTDQLSAVKSHFQSRLAVFPPQQLQFYGPPFGYGPNFIPQTSHQPASVAKADDAHQPTRPAATEPLVLQPAAEPVGKTLTVNASSAKNPEGSSIMRGAAAKICEEDAFADRKKCSLQFQLDKPKTSSSVVPFSKPAGIRAVFMR